MSLSLPEPPRRRRPGLTPMIDVVFLLLIFFMLASRFGTDDHLPLRLSGAGDGYGGPMRLVEIAPDGLRLNGRPVAAADLGPALAALMDSPEDIVVLRSRDGARLQEVVDVIALLSGLGLTRLTLVEAPR